MNSDRFVPGIDSLAPSNTGYHTNHVPNNPGFPNNPAIYRNQPSQHSAPPDYHDNHNKVPNNGTNIGFYSNPLTRQHLYYGPEALHDNEMYLDSIYPPTAMATESFT